MDYTERLIGRKSEINHFTALLQKGNGIIGYYGFGGIGKTYLLNVFTKMAETYYKVTCENGGIIDSPLSFVPQIIDSLINQANAKQISTKWQDELNKTLSMINVLSNDLYKPISNKNSQNIYSLFGNVNQVTQEISLDFGNEYEKRKIGIIEEVVRLFNNVIKNQPNQIIIFFDTLERTSPEGIKWLKYFIDYNSSNVIFVCFGRNQNSLLTERLDEFTNDETIEYLRSYEIPPEFIPAVLRLTRIPVCLKLAVAYIRDNPKADPLTFINYDCASDKVHLVQKFLQSLILDRLHEEIDLSCDDEKIIKRQTYVLLKYGVILMELNASLIDWIFSKSSYFRKNFPDVGNTENLILHASNLSIFEQQDGHLVVHDTIRELQVAMMKEIDYPIYIDLNLQASKYYFDLLQKMDQSVAGSFEDLLSGKQVIEITYPKAWNASYEKWRKTITNLVFYLINANEIAGIEFIKIIEAQIYYSQWNPFWANTLRMVDLENVHDAANKYWVQLRQAAGKLTEEISIYQNIISTVEPIDVNLRIEAAWQLIRHYLQIGDHVSVEIYLESIKIYINNLESTAQSKVYVKLGDGYRAIGNNCESVRYFELALQKTTDRKLRAHIFLQIAIEYRRLLKYDLAEKMAQESALLWGSVDDLIRLGETHIALGDIYRYQEKWQESYDHYTMAVKCFNEYDSIFHETSKDREIWINLYGSALMASARIQLKKGMLNESKIKLIEAINMQEIVRHNFHLATSKRILGLVYYRLGETNNSVRLILESLIHARQAEYIPHIIQALCCLYIVYEESGMDEKRQEIKSEIENLSALTEHKPDAWFKLVQLDIQPI
jgi:tetratricopeptide (TPR) repeat protein